MKRIEAYYINLEEGLHQLNMSKNAEILSVELFNNRIYLYVKEDVGQPKVQKTLRVAYNQSEFSKSLQRNFIGTVGSRRTAVAHIFNERDDR